MLKYDINTRKDTRVGEKLNLNATNVAPDDIAW